MGPADYHADTLRHMRKLRKLSQSEVASAVGYTRMMIYLAETQCATLPVLRALANFYSVPLTSLLRHEPIQSVERETATAA